MAKGSRVSLLVFAFSSLAAGCSAETEVTTELSANAPAGAPAKADDSSAPAGEALSPAANAGASPSDETGIRPSGLDGTAASKGSASSALSSGGPSLDVPATAYCASVTDWKPAWAEFEDSVLALVNLARSKPADCHSEGMFPAAQPLAMDPVLRCSARLHSLDMFDRNYFDHTDPDGKNPFQRMQAAGFRGSGGGENIAVGQTTPEQVMESWMASDGHCANVMRASYRLIGVGYHPGAGGRGLGSNYWTQNFGTPLAPSPSGARN